MKAVVTHPKTLKQLELEFYITSVHKQPILSKETCIAFEMISVIEENICSLDPSTNLTAEAIVQQYPDVFKGIGKLQGL